MNIVILVLPLSLGYKHQAYLFKPTMQYQILYFNQQYIFC